MTDFTPAREQDAYFVIRGFVYQVDTTILRWLHLSADEMLELERGEDIDHLSKQLGEGFASQAGIGEAENLGEDEEARRDRLLEQIKCHEDTVTLTSARATLANFAAHRRTNKRWRLRFRYTTNASVGVERPYAVPSFKQAAIHVWREIAGGDLEAPHEALGLREIRQALVSYSCPPDFESDAGRAAWTQFQDGIHKSSDAEFLEFIRDFEWSTGAEQPTDISEQISRELQELGITKTDEDAADAHRRLFLHVFQVLSRPRLKQLTFEDLETCLASPPDREEQRLLSYIVDFVVTWQDELRQRLDVLEQNLSTRIQHSAAGVKEHIDLRLAQQNAAQAVEQRLNDVRHLLAEGKWRSALAQLRRVSQDVRDAQHSLGEQGVHLMSRIAANKGLCHWHLEQTEAAQRAFEEELRWTPDSARAKGHLALALQDSQPARALQLADEARRDAEVWPSATGILLHALYIKHGWKAVAARLKAEPDAKHHGVVMVTLGTLALRGRRYRAAQHYSRHAIKAGLEGHSLPSAYRLLADALIAPLYSAQEAQHHGSSDSRFFAQSTSAAGAEWSSSAKEQWQEAEAALSRVIELTTGWQTPGRRQLAFAQRAQARYRLSLDAEALQDCDRVLSDVERDETRPEYPQTYFIKGLVLAQTERKSAAVEAFAIAKKRNHDEVVRFQATLFGAQVLAQMEQWQQVIDWLASWWTPEVTKPHLIGVASALLRAYHHLGQSEEVAAVRRDLVGIYANDPVAWGILSEQSRRESKPRVVIRQLEMALRLAKCPPWPHALEHQIAYDLSIEHAMRGHHRRAAILLKPLVDPARPDNALYQYLLCLDKTGRHQQALELARQARNNGPAIVPHSVIEAAIAEEAGDLHLAARLRRELAQANPEHIGHALRLAYIENELGHPEAARSAVESIPFATVASHPHDLMRVAQSRADFGLPDALEWAYRARKLVMSDAEIHFRYVRILYYLLPEAALDPLLSLTHVQPECAVHLRRHGRTEVLVVTGHPVTEIPDVQQVPLDDPRARVLIDKRVGDKVTFRQGAFSGCQVPHEIVEIQSKYIHALHETLRFFEQGTLYHERFEASHHDPGNEQELIEQMRALTGQGAANARSLYEFYRQHPVPLSTLALLQNRSLLDVWDGGFGLQFYVQENTADEWGGALRLLGQLNQDPCANQPFSRETPVVLDTTALLFIHHIGLAERVAEHYSGRLLVPQPVREEFAYVLRESEKGPPPSGYLSGDGTALQFYKTSPQFHEARRDLWRQVLRFIDENTEVAPVYGLARSGLSERQIYTRPTLAAVLLAKERNCPLMSDDLRVRLYGQFRHKVFGFWTHALLIHLALREDMSAEEYAEALRNLVLAGQGYLPQSGGFLLWLCARHDWELTEEVRWFFGQLHEWRLTDAAATEIVAEFLWRLKRQPVNLSRKVQLQEAVLEALVRNRNVPSTLRQLKGRLRTTAVGHQAATHQPVTGWFVLFCLNHEIDDIAPKLVRREHLESVPNGAPE